MQPSASSREPLSIRHPNLQKAIYLKSQSKHRINLASVLLTKEDEWNDIRSQMPNITAYTQKSFIGNSVVIKLTPHLSGLLIHSQGSQLKSTKNERADISMSWIQHHFEEKKNLLQEEKREKCHTHSSIVGKTSAIYPCHRKDSLRSRRSTQTF